MKKTASLRRFFALLLSSYCYSPLLDGNVSCTAAGGSATCNINATATFSDWQTAITTMNTSGGGRITFNPSLTGSTITIAGTGSLQLLTTSPVTINSPTGPYIAISGTGVYPCLYLAPGASTTISNMTFTQGYSLGGMGGSLFSEDTGFGGGGGGGLGAGAGLFIDSSASVHLTNVSFTNNRAQGGSGGDGKSGIEPNAANGGGGGGGAFYGAVPGVTCGGGLGTYGAIGGTVGGGGGGGGAGFLVAPTFFPAIPLGGTGGGLSGGAGGGTGATGGAGLGAFAGGGGGGGYSPPFFQNAGSGGTGGDFGGGGGGGGGEVIVLGVGGLGGFGGGGGGAGGAPNSGLSTVGGMGGFGGGGGGGCSGGSPSSLGASSLYAGGTGGSDMFDPGGGGGAALGGAIFIRDQASLTIELTNPSFASTLFSSNSVTGGLGGFDGGGTGMAYSPDLFLNAGGELTFLLSAPLTIGTPICSDPRIFNNDQPVNVMGGTSSAILTLTGNNTFGGGISVSGASLIVNSDGNLGSTATGGTVALSGVSSLILNASPFSTARPFIIGTGGGVINNQAGGTASLQGIISGPGPLTFSSFTGTGPTILSGTNTYSGGTLFSEEILVQISSAANLGATGATLGFAGGSLQVLSSMSLPAPFSVQSNGGVLLINPSTNLTLSGTMTGSGPFTFLGLGSNADVVLNLSSNTNSGGLTIESCSVFTGSGSNLGTSTVTLKEGILGFTGSTTASNPLVIGSGGGKIWIDGGVATNLSSGVTLTDNLTIETVNGASQLTIAGAIAGAGALAINGPGTTTLSSKASSYSGVTTLSGGELVIAGNSSLGLSTNSLSLSGILSITGSAGTFTHPLTANASTIQTASNSNWTISSGITISGGSLTLESGGTLTMSQMITGPGSLTVNGPGTVIVTTNSSNYSGGTTLNGGALEIFGPLGSSGSTITIQGGVLQIGSSMSVTQPMSLISGGIQVNGGVSAEFTNPFSISGPFSLTSLASASSVISSAVTISGSGALSLLGSGSNAINGAISGAGSLICSGSNISLSGNNSGLSGAMTINSGGVVGISSTPLALPPSCVNNGTLNLNLSSGTFSNSISGNGLVQLTTAGHLFFSGNNTYTGGTSLFPGTILTIMNANSIPSGGPISLRGSLIFDHASGVAAPGTITGGSNLGSLTMQGAGTLLLASNNPYKGGTTILDGTVILGQGGSLGTGSLTLGFNSSDLNPITLDFSSNSSLQTLTTSGIVLAGGALTFNVAGSWETSCPITSPSNLVPLTISGPGIFYYSGTNSSSASTTVSAGVVLEGGSFAGPMSITTGGSLEGSGSVGALTNAGTVHPSVGEAITVNGDYTQTSQGELQIDIRGTGDCGSVQATGVANLDGTLSVFVPSIGAYALNQTYEIVTAESKTGGVGLFGTFHTVNLPPIPKMSITYYADPMVVLTVTEKSILVGASVQGHNPNQVFENLQTIPVLENTDLLNVLNVLAGLGEDSAQLSAALNQLHPAPFGAFELVNLNTSSFITSILARRQDEVCCSHAGSACSLPKASFWTHPFGYLYHQGKIGEQVGFNDKTIGFVSGFDYCGDGGFLIGVGGGYSTSQVNWHQDRGALHMQSSFLSLYTDYSDRYAYLEFSVTGSIDHFSGYRNIDFSSVTGSVDRRAKHTNNGCNAAAHLGVGGTISLGRGFLGPYFSSDYVYLQQNKFTETGADSLDLTVNARHTQMLRSEAGIEIGISLPMQERGCFAPTLFFSGINESYLATHHYVANFIGEDPSFAVRTYNKPIFLFAPALDLNFSFGSRFEFSVRYGAELNQSITKQKGDIRFELLF